MEKTGPLVSIVIPAYNVEDYIAECVESVQKQIYRNLEIILVDDGSTDNTSDYCDRAAFSDSRIRVLHQENKGVVSARAAGISIACGKYLSFVDGDDWIEPDMVEKLVRQIGSADMISAGVYQERMPGSVIERVDQFKPGTYEGSQELEPLFKRMIYDQERGLLQPMTSWIHNKLYVREKAKKVHEKISPDLVFAEDSVFLYQYMLVCKSIVICDKCFYHYRYRKGSAIHSINLHMLSDINKVYLALLDTFQKHPLGSSLIVQLQKWVEIRAVFAMNESMGFDKRIHITNYIFNLKGFDDKRFVLYGAGRAGKDAYQQLGAFGYDIVLWVDKNYLNYQKQGFCVKSPSEIAEYAYDLIFIAIEDEGTAEEIRGSLIGNGFPECKIVWRKPVRTY